MVVGVRQVGVEDTRDILVVADIQVAEEEVVVVVAAAVVAGTKKPNR